MMAFYNWNIVAPSFPTLCTYILQPSIVPITLQIAAPQLNLVPKQTEPSVPQPATVEDVVVKTMKEEPVEEDDKIKDWSSCDVKEEPDSDADAKYTPNGSEKPKDWAEVLIKEEVEEADEKARSKSKTGRRLFKCEFCAYTTNWKGNLTKHMVSRHTALEEIKWLECEHCSYKGKTKDYLKCHLLHVHNISVKWYNCPHCPFKAKSKSLLTRHTLVNHTNSEQIQWFKCAHCSYRAKQRSSLKDHVLNKHTEADNIQWFQCDWCDFIAKRKRNLKLHQINKHTKEDQIRWFQCEDCTCKFKRKSALNIHVETVHRSSANRHSKPETREIPVFIDSKLCWKRIVVSGNAPKDHVFKCGQCAFSSEDKKAFKKHVLKMHTVTEIREKAEGIVKKTYKTKNVTVIVDDVPCVRRVIDRPLSDD